MEGLASEEYYRNAIRDDANFRMMLGPAHHANINSSVYCFSPFVSVNVFNSTLRQFHCHTLSL